MKAILALNGQAIPRTHDLWSLARFLSPFRFPMAKLRKTLHSLTLIWTSLVKPPAFTTMRH